MIPNIHLVYVHRVLDFLSLFHVFVTGVFYAYFGDVLAFMEMSVMCI